MVDDVGDTANRIVTGEPFAWLRVMSAPCIGPQQTRTTAIHTSCGPEHARRCVRSCHLAVWSFLVLLVSTAAPKTAAIATRQNATIPHVNTYICKATGLPWQLWGVQKMKQATLSATFGPQRYFPLTPNRVSIGTPPPHYSPLTRLAITFTTGAPFMQSAFQPRVPISA